MEGPFFMKRWNPARRAYFTQSKRSPSKPKAVSIPSPSKRSPSKPKAVSIPSPSKPKVSNDYSKKQAAAAAGSRKDHRLAAAMKIQKVFRGFLVRKSVRTVRRLASEAESIARRIEAEEVEIRRDAKERLRLGEMLMSLLLRLDSVRGIREYRKKVIRRVISLQEAVDSIRGYSKKRAAAVKIQKNFRGFLIRKSVRTVRRLASEAESIARRIEAEEVVIRRDAKERLRVDEMLMSLLLRLDSVRGIREYRKKVIRRVISLQKVMDSIREYSKKRAAAVKIQKVFRGFLVRKSVRTVRRLASEAESIARRIEAEEVVIRRDAKERLRVDEMLMSLLPRFDSVRGIREYRKKVIRRVISLQEVMDSIREYSEKLAAAVKIQKVSRGFLVRKSVRTVRRLASEVESIARRIEAEEVKNRREAKERLRLGEMLMSLLLRLDSVRGIREYRKKVIRRVISLQEAMDSTREYSKKRAAAVKIQKVFRGFLVRKSVRTVRRLASEAESIARRIEAEEVEIRRDAKERLRVGQMLMSLLLRLDSVCGIREYRKKVIRRVISLQEAVDSISVSNGTPPGRSLEAPESIEKMPQNSNIYYVEDSETLGMKEVIKRVAADNERLKMLVAELCEGNVEQCRLMSRLVERVEQRKERKKNKRSQANRALASSLREKCGGSKKQQ